MEQRIITAAEGYRGIDEWLAENRVRKLLLVCGGSARSLPGISAKLEELAERGVSVVKFSDFRPNPTYESVLEGVRLFRGEKCDAVAAVGGGSAMDVAKCIKLYSGMSGDGADGAYLGKTPAADSDIPFLAMPTTAGTGSEATRYAVIYYQGEKQSVTSETIIPNAVLMDPGALKTLPRYQRAATMMDALCHAIESFWSVNSTEESRTFSAEAVRGILAAMDGYMDNTEQGNAGMLMAAYTAGRAINIAQTTAGHAMCYKLTSLFGCAHGHAAILCDRVPFPWMLRNIGLCTDPRGEGHLRNVFDAIARAMGCETAEAAAMRLNGIFDGLGLEIPAATREQYEILRSGVNPVRLKNHPIRLEPDTIDELYHKILR